MIPTKPYTPRKRATKKNPIRGKFNQLRYRMGESTTFNTGDMVWVTELLELDLEVFSPSREDLERANRLWKQYA